MNMRQRSSILWLIPQMATAARAWLKVESHNSILVSHTGGKGPSTWRPPSVASQVHSREVDCKQSSQDSMQHSSIVSLPALHACLFVEEQLHLLLIDERFKQHSNLLFYVIMYCDKNNTLNCLQILLSINDLYIQSAYVTHVNILLKSLSIISVLITLAQSNPDIHT